MRYLSILLITLVPSAFAADNGRSLAVADEEVFDIAKHYTVKVRTQVELPFYGDKKGTAIGAGFVVDESRGLILTNAHVVSRSPARVAVSFLGGDYVGVKTRYVDPYMDLAIIEIERDKFPKTVKAAQLDCTTNPAIGHAVGAFGHPWDLSYTGTRGIVSGITGKYAGQLEMLQTDAPINPGNSGGPLISLKTGKVVGVNTATRKSSQNTNFAVPMVQACRVLALWREGRDPSPPQLPVSFYKDVDETNRLTVARVYDEESEVTLKVGDVIEGVTGANEAVGNRGRLLHLLRGQRQPMLNVAREGAKVQVSARFKPAPRTTERQGVYASGVLFAATPWRDFDDLFNRKIGLMVHYVERGTAGDAQKIETMDLLASLDGHPVADLNELHERLKNAEAARRLVKLKFLRLGDLDEQVFSYLERPLSVADLKRVGPGTEIAAKP
jgi:S1-C subfamily serine protease